MSTPKRKLLDSMDDFTSAYIECALWTSNAEDKDGNPSEPMDENFGPEDIAVDSLKRIISDCKEFQEENEIELIEAYEFYGPTSDGANPQERAGHDFWLTRNGHGAGYWDRGLGAVGDALTKASKEYGDIGLYLFRGKIWLQ